MLYLLTPTVTHGDEWYPSAPAQAAPSCPAPVPPPQAAQRVAIAQHYYAAAVLVAAAVPPPAAAAFPAKTPEHK